MTKTELKAKVRATGSHFFDPDTMRFFNSKLISVYEGPSGVFFVTYEKGPHGPGAYTIRTLRHDGVSTVGDFNALPKAAATKMARTLAGHASNTYHKRPRSYGRRR